MLQKQSIKTHIVRLVITSLIITAVLLVIVFLFSIRFSQLRAHGRTYSHMISELNQMLLELNLLEYEERMDFNDNPEYPLNSYYQRLESIEDNLDTLERGARQLGGELDTYPLRETLRNSGDIDFYEIHQSVQDIRLSLRPIYAQTIQELNFYESAGFVLFLFYLSFMLAVIFNMARYVRRYYENMSKITTEITGILRYSHKQNSSIATRWKEDQDVVQAVNDISVEMDFQRKLLEVPGNTPLEEFLPKLLPIIQEVISCNRLGVAFLIRSNRIVAETSSADYPNIKLKAGFSATKNETSLFKLIENQQSRIINDLPAHYEKVRSSEATKLLLEEGIKSSLTLPFSFGSDLYGVFFISSKKLHAFSQHDEKKASWILQHLKTSIFASFILQEMLYTNAKAFADIVEKKDYETGNHISRVSEYSYILSEAVRHNNPQISHKFSRDILKFSALHDIGKVGIPDNILLKPGKLSSEEMSIMQGHVLIGEDIINRLNESHKETIGYEYFKTASDIISGHHEYWDGRGYPNGLCGDAIPLAGRIVAIADVFDALTTPRPYKPAFSLEKTLKILKEESGTHFDPELISLFFENIDDILEIYYSDEYRDQEL
ncbi:MAG: HD domain-containing phosphohydrolase [Spirochaetia bacterium]